MVYLAQILSLVTISYFLGVVGVLGTLFVDVVVLIIPFFGFGCLKIVLFCGFVWLIFRLKHLEFVL